MARGIIKGKLVDLTPEQESSTVVDDLSGDKSYAAAVIKSIIQPYSTITFMGRLVDNDTDTLVTLQAAYSRMTPADSYNYFDMVGEALVLSKAELNDLITAMLETRTAAISQRAFYIYLVYQASTTTQVGQILKDVYAL